MVVYSADMEDFDKLGIEDKKPGFEKCCGVFETLGEKRLATHLIGGLVRILA